MTPLYKLLTMTLSLFTVVVFFAYVGWLMGYDGFLLIQHLDLTPTTQRSISFILFFIQTLLHFGIILNVYDYSLIKMTLPYTIIYWISELFISQTIIASTILPIAYVFVLACIRKDLFPSFIRTIKLISVEALYQGIALVIKTQVWRFGYCQVTQYQNLIYAIDLIILLVVLYCKGGEQYYARNFKLALFTEDIERVEHDSEDVQALKEFQQLRGWRSVGAMTLLLGFQVLQWLITLTTCYIGNVFREGLVISTSFICYGFIVKKRWHSNSVVVCTLISTTLFYTSARLIPSFQYTQLLPVVIGLLLIYSLYKVAVYTDNHKELESYVEKLTSFKLEKYCDYDNMLEIAKIKGLTSKEIDLINYKYCKACTWAAMEVRFSPWSLSSIKRYLKDAERKFYS